MKKIYLELYNQKFIYRCNFPYYNQLLIIMYKDIITKEKIPGIYILMNNRNELSYNMIFEEVINLITFNRLLDLEIETIVTDSERALMNAVKTFFPKAQRVACYFHFKEDILRNLRVYGLYKEEDKVESKKVLKLLSTIPYIYNRNIYKFDYILNEIKKQFSRYSNFIDNYFLKTKKELFIDNSLNYQIIPEDCRNNNLL